MLLYHLLFYKPLVNITLKEFKNSDANAKIIGAKLNRCSALDRSAN